MAQLGIRLQEVFDRGSQRLVGDVALDVSGRFLFENRNLNDGIGPLDHGGSIVVGTNFFSWRLDTFFGTLCFEIGFVEIAVGRFVERLGTEAALCFDLFL